MGPAALSVRAVARELTAVRGWARRHLHDYALLYGSPVPGYAAPADTVWSGLIGSLTLELFGHLHNAVDDYDAWFEHTRLRIAPF